MDLQIALLLGQDGIVERCRLRIDGARAGAGVFGHARHLHSPGRVRRLRGALHGDAAGRPRAGHAVATAGAGCHGAAWWNSGAGSAARWSTGPPTLTWCVALPALACAPCWCCCSSRPRWRRQPLTTLLLIVPLGPLLYRLAYRPLADASVLMLLIVSVALHGVLVGLGLLFFGAEGSRTTPFSEARFDVGGIPVSGQSLVVVGVTLLLVIAMFLFFGRSMVGKALRATAINRVGARLVGHSNRAVGRPELCARGAHRRHLGPADRAAHHGVLRHRLPDRPEGLRRRHRRRARQLSAGTGGRTAGRPARDAFASFWASRSRKCWSSR